MNISANSSTKKTRLILLNNSECSAHANHRPKEHYETTIKDGLYASRTNTHSLAMHPATGSGGWTAVRPGSTSLLYLMREEYCLYAIDAVYAHLANEAPTLPAPCSKDSYPMFVSWKHAETNQLRGCIGTTNPCVLADGLRIYAIRSAFNDDRFPPVNLDELKELVCTVSLLNNYEHCDGWRDWSIGKHGISIEFNEDSGRIRRALFLPEVMVEHEMGHKAAVEQLLRKSGYRGKITETLLEERLNVTRFRTQKTSLAVTEYFKSHKK